MTKPGLYALKLHVYELGPDYVVAHTEGAAWKIWSEVTGESDARYRQDLRRVPDDLPLRIWVRPDGQIAEPGEDGAQILELTCGEWAAREGVGFLCSSEY